MPETRRFKTISASPVEINGKTYNVHPAKFRPLWNDYLRIGDADDTEHRLLRNTAIIVHSFDLTEEEVNDLPLQAFSALLKIAEEANTIVEIKEGEEQAATE